MTFPTKEDAHAAMERARAEWLAKARSVARTLAARGAEITVDDVRRIAPPLPEGADPRVFGCIFAGTEWERVGGVNSTRRTCHKRPISKFRWRYA